MIHVATWRNLGNVMLNKGARHQGHALSDPVDVRRPEWLETESGFVVAWGWERRRHWHPTPVLLPRESHGWRSLVGCSPCGRWESDTTERLHFHFSPLCIGEGNGNPLQCSCLENPRDGKPGGLPSMGSHRVGHD